MFCGKRHSILPHSFAASLMLLAAAGCAADESSRPASDGGVSVRSDGGTEDAGRASPDASIGPDAANDADGGERATCGDGIREGDEACDGEDLGEASCAELGYRAGTPGCTSRCTLAPTICESPVYRMAATGDGFSCAIRESGAVDCWGLVTSPSGTFEHISAGYYPCGVTTDHVLVCWGHGDALALPTGRFTTVEVTNERLLCFGNNAPSVA